LEWLPVGSYGYQRDRFDCILRHDMGDEMSGPNIIIPVPEGAQVISYTTGTLTTETPDDTTFEKICFEIHGEQFVAVRYDGDNDDIVITPNYE
jgi:hypothetical protein